MKYAVTINAEKSMTIEINDDHHVLVDGVEYIVDFASVGGQPVFSLLIDGRSHEAYIAQGDDGWNVLLHGEQYTIQVEDEREKRLRMAATASAGASSGEFHLKAPMPGLIVATPVAEGQAVRKGEILIVLESMKMQNELKSPRAGTIHRVKVQPGQGVDQGEILVTMT